MSRIGILAVQGAFLEHEQVLSRLGVPYFELRQKRDLEESMDGLILPGGESTVMGKLLRELELMEPLRSRILAGLPVFGTCAGLILLAKQLAGGETTHLASMDICAVRNAYGRQLGSFAAEQEFGDFGRIPMTVSGKTEVLAQVDGRIVAAREDRQLVTAFHPELTEDLTVHRYFLDQLVASR